MTESIIELAAALVRIRSRAGLDPVGPIVEFLGGWLESRGLEPRRLRGPGGAEGGLYLHLESGAPGPALCLDACLDTAPFGDEETWRHPPTSGVVEGGRLYGRGAADSKIAVALFSHLAAELRASGGPPRGDLFVVFDADEHSGDFYGIKNFLEVAARPPEAVVIGYPGNEKLIIGSRGFLRAEVVVHGRAAHSGSSSARGLNAVRRAARLVELLSERPLPEEPDPDFHIGPQLTVTGIEGGEGFSLVPDLCRLRLDFRLTPHVDRAAASRWVESVVGEADEEARAADAGARPTQVAWKESWPAYRVPPRHPLAAQFLEAAREVFGREVTAAVSGPSNIGNYLAARGIPALSGFGVTYADLHATDESVELESVGPVYEVYRRAVGRLLRAGLPQAAPRGA